MITHKTDKQVEIERLDNNHEYNYRIVTGNPLTASIDKEIFANTLKMNNYAFAVNYFEISEYNKEIEIQEKGNLVNIVLDN